MNFYESIYMCFSTAIFSSLIYDFFGEKWWLGGLKGLFISIIFSCLIGILQIEPPIENNAGENDGMDQ